MARTLLVLWELVLQISRMRNVLKSICVNLLLVMVSCIRRCIGKDTSQVEVSLPHVWDRVGLHSIIRSYVPWFGNVTVAAIEDYLAFGRLSPMSLLYMESHCFAYLGFDVQLNRQHARLPIWHMVTSLNLGSIDDHLRQPKTKGRKEVHVAKSDTGSSCHSFFFY